MCFLCDLLICVQNFCNDFISIGHCIGYFHNHTVGICSKFVRHDIGTSVRYDTSAAVHTNFDTSNLIH